ncbi:MAG: globin [Candidatus Nanopelagicales bacterium]|nr:globin [Candidatus Nanopelagicales bacterium]
MTQKSVEPTPFELFGGHEFFEKLVHSFYEKVPDDPILSTMYPENDYAGAEWRLRSFLEQYWGGPTTYSDERGHPRLRMRHEGFHIDTEARNHWLLLMAASVQEQGMPAELEAELWKYLVAAAYGMQNVPDENPEHSPEIPVTEV